MRENLWTDKDVETLTKMWNDGVVASKIGEFFGRTKNAVIGKADRLGLVRRADNRYNYKPKNKDIKTKYVSTREFEVELADIGPNQCRFMKPTKDRDYRCCGMEIHKGSFCEKHYDICWIK